MGIPTALVRSRENSTGQPNGQQLKVLASLLGYDADFDPTKEGLFS
jgi:hypothetical protein